MIRITSLALFLSSVSTVSAFVPSQVGRSVTAIKAENDDDGLWGKPTPKGDEGDMSIALPFAPRPKLLDGSFPGDVGFE